MGGLYALLYYPYDIEEQNPADIPGWGRWYYDPTFGMTLMRNRFQDDDDSLVMFNGKFRSAEGGHNAPDGPRFPHRGRGPPLDHRLRAHDQSTRADDCLPG